VSMAMPDFSSTVLITRSALLVLAVEKRFSGPRPLNRISCVRMRVFIEVYDDTIIVFHFIFGVMTLGRITRRNPYGIFFGCHVVMNEWKDLILFYRHHQDISYTIHRDHPSSTSRRCTLLSSMMTLEKVCCLIVLLASTTSVEAFNIKSVSGGSHGGGGLLIPQPTLILSKTHPLSSNILTGVSALPYVPSKSVTTSSNHYLSTSGVTENESISERRTPSNSKRIVTIASVTLAMTLALTSNTGVANAARKSAATLAAKTSGAISSGPPLVLPSMPTLALVCLLPTLLGYYRSEYGVSYGYGTAILASSYLVLSSIATSAGLPLFPGIQDAITIRPLSSFALRPAAILTSLTSTFTNIRKLLPSSLAACHAYALCFYGKRLNLFLLYRELCLPKFRAMRERIEERSKKQGARWKRTPFILSCAFLYLCMMSPLLITSRVCGDLSMIASSCCGGGGGGGGGGVSVGSSSESRLLTTIFLEQSLRCSVVTAFLGFLLGALGDMNKTLGKKWKGEDALITGGIFRFLRHPNYTGEVIGWTSSCLAGILAVSWKTVKSGGGSCSSSCLALWKSMAPYLLLSVMGTMGITFVLATATTGLEYRQKEKYGDTEEYQRWIKSSWVGFKMTPKKDISSDGELNKGNSDAKSES
jgi:protein-S-isoprenylcysteine O-methyltransferase Ste14